MYPMSRDSWGEVKTDVEVGGEVVRCLADTGAAVTLITENDILQSKSVHTSYVMLRTDSGDHIRVLGKIMYSIIIR